MSCYCEHRAWLIDECLQTDPSKRITFNDIISHLLPSMSSEFHLVSHFCLSQQSNNTHSSVQLKNSVTTGDSAVRSEPFQQSEYGELLAVSDEMIAVDSADSDAADSEGSICEKSQCATETIVSSSSWPEQQRSLAFCAAVDNCNINNALAYRRLPAAC